MRYTVSVFGSGTIKKSSPAWSQAHKIGFLLAKTGFNVMNGGYGGAMSASAQGAKQAGGKTVGVTTSEYGDVKANAFIDREIQLPFWRERLHQLIELADGFVVLDGGTGTVTEFMVVWEMLSKRLHLKPIVVLGKRMRLLVQFLKRNPEVAFPRQLYIAKTPKDAVRFLTREIKLPSPLVGEG